jgi:hypothetical protein
VGTGEGGRRSRALAYGCLRWYDAAMNPTLQKLLRAIENWPDEDQEALAEAAREIEALRTGVYRMSPAEEAAVAEGLAEAERGDFASDARIAELWKRAGL